MNGSEKKLRDALLKIAAAAQAAVETGQYVEDDNGHPYGELTSDTIGKNAHCSIKQLPGRLVQKAAKTAVSINPTNRVNFGPLAMVARVWCCPRRRLRFWSASIGARNHDN